MRVASLPRYTSGSEGLDALLSGGYRAGTLTEVFGRSNSGKSQLGMQAALCAAWKGESVLYIDTEGAFRPERLEQIAGARGWGTEGVLERILFMRSDSAPEQMETIRRMQGRKATSRCRLVVVDTLTRNFSVELPGRSNLPSRQGALDVHLSEMARDAYINARAYLLTNRVTFGAAGDVGIGGRTVEQLVHRSVRLERQGTAVTATLLPSGERVTLETGLAGVI
ncbi:MAG: AAA family ATPase [Nitrososphaerota archaeon]|nr:AAA family ATPase [Nitrososphaerota archaeon]MDG6965050.1 AAA family ATPase [Nitrososphaerota archaeon]MDG6968098.1 AAA family ATPase [Nitrososphaerota archaeon]MDG6968976.1 AAA family ATPase [Nitrososphaerota archaeon]MDG6973609.1 AAA family ATPase [Nitrososphaerota archaeon]